MNEGGDRKSMCSELWFKNAIYDWQVENKMDCSKTVEQIFDEANLKSLTEMFTFFLIVRNWGWHKRKHLQTSTPLSICNSKWGQTHDLRHHNQIILRVLEKQANMKGKQENKIVFEWKSGRQFTFGDPKRYG